MHKSLFTLCALENNTGFEGWTDGTLWNGWATPRFEFAEAQKVVEALNQENQTAWYNEAEDSFYFEQDDSNEPESYPSLMIQTDEGQKKVYAIGAFAWTWEENEAALS